MSFTPKRFHVSGPAHVIFHLSMATLNSQTVAPPGEYCMYHNLCV